MYKAISIDFPGAQHYFVENKKLLDNLSRINIFIGPNNSGKSRFLRTLFINDRPRFLPLNTPVLTEVNERVNSINEEISIIFKKNEIKSFQTGIDMPSSDQLIDSYGEIINRWKHFLEKIGRLESLELSKIKDSKFYTFYSIDPLFRELKKLSAKNMDFFQIKNHDKLSKINRKNIYIPILRGLRELSLQDDNGRFRDNYRERTIQDYFLQSDFKSEENKARIYTGLSLYNDTKKLLLGHAPERKRMKEFEEFISEIFFNSLSFTIIPHVEDNVVHVKIGESDDFPIYQLGEGIQSIIILTYPLFFNQGEDVNFFFEEPDMHLHPGFQRIFLEALQRPEFSTFQYFMTTHSNHFLDMTLDFNAISVYTFKKESENKFLIRNMENSDRNVLEMLGIRNSSVFLTNCTIWVEGITDRMYIRQYLKQIQKEQNTSFREDIHFSFVEYGGGNITHWSFLEDDDSDHPNIGVEKLCGTLFLITDRDKESLSLISGLSKKQQRPEKLRKKLKDRYYCLKVREIENLLTEEVLQSIITEREKNKTDVDFSKLVFNNYKDQLLGEYIESLGTKHKYAASSGTIRQKVEFAKTAIKYIESTEKISDEARQLAKKILKFIQMHNK